MSRFLTPMRYILMLLMLIACSSQSNQTSGQPGEPTQTDPGDIATSNSGWTMRAKIDGKNWLAKSMMRPSKAGRIIGYTGKDYIALPYSQNFLKPGSKTVFSADEVADLSLAGRQGAFGGREGYMEITKNNAGWVEGNFHFNATQNGAGTPITVTDGFFKFSTSDK